MFDSTILDLAIGLVFTFLAVSLAASAITETIASVIKWRSKTLKQGVKDLLNDKNFDGLALEIYNHALVNPRADGTATFRKPPPNRKLPTYIERLHFARALMDVLGMSSATLQPAALKLQIASRVQDVQLRALLDGIVDRTATTRADAQALLEKIPDALPAAQYGELPDILVAIIDRTTQPHPSDPAALRARIETLQDPGVRQSLDAIVDRTANIAGVLTDPHAIKARIDAVVLNPQLRTLLHGMVDRTVGDTRSIADEIAQWFDAAMDRVGGAYKRWSQLVSFFVALALAIVLNISVIHVTRRLWTQPIETKMIAQITAGDFASNKNNSKEFISQLEALSPDIGWSNWHVFSEFWVHDLPHFTYDAWARMLGWLITAVATLFGAAFWFDALQRIVRLKGSGPSPLEKVEGKGASA